jgi:hypothetical protein
MRETIDSLQTQAAASVLSAVQLSAMRNASTPWFNIARVTRYDAIPDPDWTLMWANSLGMKVPYATCQPCDNPIDHIHACRQCASGFPTMRHDRAVSALNAAARRYGVVSTSNFYSNFGARHHDDHPDIVFYRLDDKKPLVVDLTIRHQTDAAKVDNLALGEREKNTKYAGWWSDEIEFRPLALSSNAHMPPQTLDTLKEIGKYALSGFVDHAVRQIKMAIILGAAMRQRMLEAKNRLPT